MRKPASTEEPPASKLIDGRIAELADWRGKTLARMRELIQQAEPDVVEEWKWMGTPVWERDGIICTGESYKNVVKLTFAKGAALADPAGLFNSSLDGRVRRAIDIREGEEADANAFKALIRAAVALNSSGVTAKRGRAKVKPEKSLLTDANGGLKKAKAGTRKVKAKKVKAKRKVKAKVKAKAKAR